MYQLVDHQQISKRHEELTSEELIISYRYKMFNKYIKSRDHVKNRYKTTQLEEEVRQIKEYGIRHLPELIDQTIQNMQENNINVYLAKTKEAALHKSLEFIGEEEVIVQGSSDIPAEIDLDLALKEQGKELIASGTYHRLFQLSGCAVGFNKGYSTRYYTIDDWKKALSPLSESKLLTTRQSLAEVIVDNIKEKINQATVSISGANAVAAENGSAILTHSLGNLFRVALKDQHIIMVGIDKIVKSYMDAWKTAYLESLYSDSGGGSVYQFAMRGPSSGTEVAGIEMPVHLGSKEVDVILVDNGRMKAIEQGFAEALYCIRCFSCHNHCPSYRVLGPGKGNDLREPGFGYKGYLGGRGTILSAYIFGNHKAVEAGLFTCTLCGACKKECPLKIDTPKMIMELRGKLTRSNE